MCDYCDINNKEEHFQGDDGVIYSKTKNSYYLFIEHFRNEQHRIEDIKYCQMCGRKLGD